MTANKASRGISSCVWAAGWAASFVFVLPSGAQAEKQFQCTFSTVCLETNACSSRDLVVQVSYTEAGGAISSPGQTFPVSIIQNGGDEAITFLSEEVNGSTAFLTIFSNLDARLTYHFHRPEPTVMTNFGVCE